MYVSKEESTKIRVNIYGQGHQHSARSVIGKKPMICSSYLDMHDLWPYIISLNLKKEKENQNGNTSAYVYDNAKRNL